MATESTQRIRTFQILWFAIIASTLMVFAMLLAVRQPRELELQIAPFIALAVTVAVLSVVLPRTLFATALRGVVFETREEPVTTLTESYRQGVLMRRLFNKPDEAFALALAKYSTPFVLGMALSESVAMFGFVLGFLGARIEIAGALFGASLLLQLYRFPSPQALRRTVERAANAEFGQP